MAFAGLSTVLVYKKEKCLVKSGKDIWKKRSHSGVIAELHRRNYNDFCYLNTEARSYRDNIFKFSEDTENLKNP